MQAITKQVSNQLIKLPTAIILDLYTTFCIIEKDLYNTLNSTKSELRKQARQKSFNQTFVLFADLFLKSGKSWDEYKKDLIFD